MSAKRGGPFDDGGDEFNGEVEGDAGGSEDGCPEHFIAIVGFANKYLLKNAVVAAVWQGTGP